MTSKDFSFRCIYLPILFLFYSILSYFVLGDEEDDGGDDEDDEEWDD